MNIAIVGAGSFIGKNLFLTLSDDNSNNVRLIDRKKEYFLDIKNKIRKNDEIVECDFDYKVKFADLLKDIDIVFHLLSTSIPATSNKNIGVEIEKNIVITAELLDACVNNNVKKIIFSSSGGAIYGNKYSCPVDEEVDPFPITSYGWEKLSIEKLLYLYFYQYGLDYRVLRIANPFGPYQRPNSGQGAATTFAYKAFNEEEIVVFGDGSVVRDYIYIDDVIRAILNITFKDCKYKVYNIGSGEGVSINELLSEVELVNRKPLKVKYIEGRNVDVKKNYLDVSRYEEEFGKLSMTSLKDGFIKLMKFWEDN